MKWSLLLTASLLVQAALAQPVLVPYRAGSKFGLSDEKGKLVLQPQYDELHYVQGGYFRYINRTVTVDSSRNAYGQVRKYERETISTGLLNRATLLISEQPYQHYFIYAHCIIGSQNPAHPENCALFSMKGEKLLPEVRGLGVNDSRETGSLGRLTDRFSLISIFERNRAGDRLFSLALYDNVQQQLKGYLLNRVMGMRVDRLHSDAYHILYTYRSDEGQQEKYLRFANDGFEMADRAVVEAELKGSGTGRMGGGIHDDVAVDMGSTAESTPVRPAVRPTEAEAERSAYYFFQQRGDSLFYVKAGNKLPVQLPPQALAIRMEGSGSSAQRQSLIYRLQGRFGLVVKGQVQEPIYDSLLYFGDDFIAYRRTGGKLVGGTVARDGNPLIPFMYDSIEGGMKKFRFMDNGHGNNAGLQLNLYDAGSEYDYGRKLPYAYRKTGSEQVLVYLNGKAGIVGRNNEALVPIQYDWIAESGGANFGPPRRGGFVVLKKNGHYGIALFLYSQSLKKYQLSMVMDAVLPYIPCFYWPGYYGRKGFGLYGLYDDAFNFKGYAGENRVLYFRE